MSYRLIFRLKGELMLESKRKFERQALPLEIKFRPTYGAKDYSTADTVNLSFDGLGMKAHNFSFIIHENLELLVDVPGNKDTVALFGDIVWKRQRGEHCLAGIKFRMKDKIMQAAAIEKILAAAAAAGDTAFADLPDKLGVVKEYHEGGTKCRVTFRLLREMAKDTQVVTVVGDFNDWDISRSRMSRLANGDFVMTMDLDSRRQYRYKYLIDGYRWENDWYADRYERNDKGSKDSVVIV